MDPTIAGDSTAAQNAGLMGDREAALEKVQVVLKYEPDHPDALTTLARLQAEVAPEP
jgi:hypothetical protein